MPGTQEQTSSKKVFDVAKPSTTPANPTSRPLIVNHGPIAKDTTVVDKDTTPGDEGSIEEPKQAMLSKHAIIQPLESQESELNVVPEEKIEEEIPQEQPKEEQPEEVKPKEEQPEEAEKPELKNLSEAQLKKIEEEEQKRQQERDAQIDQLVGTGKYFLPINSVEKRKNRRIVLAGIVLCLLLAVVWYDVALDAGIVSNILKLPHTHFFELKS